jgi:O-antigen/teichoic acid export membrane protein
MSKLRTLASDTAIYGVSTIVQRFLTFLLTPFYTNFLVPAELGEVSYLYALIPFVNILYSLGLDAAFFRFFKTSGESGPVRHHNRLVFGCAFTAIASMAGTCTLAMVLLRERIASGLDFHAVSGSIVALAACIAFFDALTLIPYAAMRMERHAKRFAGTKLAVVVVQVALNLVLVAGVKMGVQGIFMANIISSLMGVVLVSPELMRFLGEDSVRAQASTSASTSANASANASVSTLASVPSQMQASSSSRFDTSLFGEMWRFGLPSLPSAFSAMMLQVSDRPLMKLLLGDAAVGIYQANFRLGIPMMLMVTVFEQAWKPFYLREAGSHDARTLFPRVLTYFTLAAVLVFLLVALFIEYVVQMPFIGGRFMNPKYLSGLGVVPVVLVGYYFNGVFTNLAAAVYIRKRTKYLPIATGVAAAVSVALNLVLMPQWGMLGSAFAMVGAYSVSALMMCRIARRIYPLRYEWGKVFLLCALAGGTFLVARTMTAGMPMLPALFLRLCCLGGMIALLPLLGFFTQRERQALKRVVG